MIAVDTSVWIAALRDDGSREATVLAELLDADEVLLPIPVKIELLSGTSKRDRTAMASGLEALPVAYPNFETWRTIVNWTGLASDAGVAFGVGDLLIAAIAAENGASLWSLDSAFDRLERMRLIAQYEPPRRREPLRTD